MNPQSPNELISAYFDGEVTPEERAAVERLLIDSEESQRELNETARLSALLHSFPRESAPVDLVGNVQQQTGRLPLPVRVVATVPPQIAPSRNAWREWRAALISAVSTAAVLIVFWNLFDVPKPMEHPLASHAPLLRDGLEGPAISAKLGPVPLNGPLASNGQMRDQTTIAGFANPNGAEAESAKAFGAMADSALADATPAEAQSVVPLQGKAPSIAAADADTAEEPLTRKKIAATAQAAQAPGAPVAELAATSQTGLEIPLDQLSFDGLNPDLTLPNGDFLNGLKAGAILKYTPRPADPLNNVAVVDLEVVDVDRGLAEIQVVLQKHSIRQFVEGDDARTKREAKEKNLDELVVIWAVAPGEQLANALQDVNRHPDLFPKWSSAPPLQIAMNSTSEVSDKGKADARKESDAKQSPTAVPQEPADELAESQLALQALANRNSIRMNYAALNAAPQAAMKPQGLAGNGNAKDDNGGFPGRFQNAEAETRSLSMNQAGSNLRRYGASAKLTQGYEVIRIPSSEMNLSSNSVSYRGNAYDLAERQNEKSRSRGNNSAGPANSARLSQPGLSPPGQALPDPAMATAMTQKVQGADSAGGAVKMLFVLHPMQAETESTPVPSNNRD